MMLTLTVNEILGDHNVDKQITDNKGDVRKYPDVAKYGYSLNIGCLPHGRH
jgi:hypothetical protein